MLDGLDADLQYKGRFMANGKLQFLQSSLLLLVLTSRRENLSGTPSSKTSISPGTLTFSSDPFSVQPSSLCPPIFIFCNAIFYSPVQFVLTSSSALSSFG
jgi:hypothetical protein